ncbi:Ig-like domain-containing protein [Methanoplanus endosymbiosus]|uniref:Ig-like domain-containing protein n=1 Tax=Methanoplanus endosymbiosus TaxID=33865 RepID=A0A9E7PLU1_9EURY|nr:Ig-like domain-containing protein [Methanoplanus endosymbiosus]UUX92555.1 Ig-like domain-containing protein [Methanoplanus endosymbiosus]
MKKIIIFLLGLALLSSAVSASDWQVNVTYKVDSTSGFVTNFDILALGTKTGATDGYDEGIDVHAPPKNPDGYDQYIKVSGCTDSFYKAFCSPLSSEVTTKEWKLYLVVGDKEEDATRDITLSWDSSNVPDEISVLTMNIGSETKDMLTETEWSFSRDGNELSTRAYINAEYRVQSTPVLTNITIEPSQVSVEEDNTQLFTATGYDQDGHEMTGLTFAWSSSNTTVGTVDSSTGLFTADNAGTTTVSATSGGKTGNAEVTVTRAAPVLTEITVNPAQATLLEGEKQQFTATGYDQYGSVITGISFSWTSSNTKVGTVVSSTGLFTADNAGTTTVSATSGGKTGNAEVTVTRAAPVLTEITVNPAQATLLEDEKQQFTATGYDQYGSVITGISFSWTSSNTTVGTVVSSTGLFTADNAGTTTVSATSGGKTGNAEVTVTRAAPVLTEITVNPAQATLLEDEKQQFTATGYDQYGSVITGISFSWTSSNTTVGTVVSSTGLFTADNAGTTTVSATSGGKTSNAQVTVTSMPMSEAMLSLLDLEVKKYSSGIVPLSIGNISNGEGFNVTISWDSKVIDVNTVRLNETAYGNLSLYYDLTENSAVIQISNPDKFNTVSSKPVVDLVYKAVGNKNDYSELSLCDASCSCSFNKYECFCMDGSVTIVGIKGDFNVNNEIDIGDSCRVAYMVADKTPVNIEADFNNDGKVDVGDAAKIAYFIIGKISSL